ncbi:hypothetical protein RCH07_001031 [Arthrobacter sp. CG_A4]|nr:hypothetical protein [Arthrobacter sp. CG_A4]
MLAVGLAGIAMIMLGAVYFMRHPRSRGERIGPARAWTILAILAGLVLLMLFVVVTVSRGSI